jgi:hypothetical protein
MVRPPKGDGMSFADEVKKENRGTGQRCRTCVLLEQLDPTEAADIIAVLNDKTVPTEPIARAMNNRGLDISGNAVRKHRLRCVIP